MTGKRGRRLKLTSDRKGYRWFTVAAPMAEGGHGRVYVHMLVAAQKFGAAALGVGVEVRHLNRSKSDNSMLNITVGTSTQNKLDEPATKRLRIGRHAASYTRKLTVDKLRELRRDRQAGATYKELMHKYGLAKSTVSYVVRGKTYRN